MTSTASWRRCSPSNPASTETGPKPSPAPSSEASRRPRLSLALAVDGGCLAVLYLIVAGLIYIVTHLDPPFPPQLILPVLVLLYFIVCWGVFGATPGMYALDLRLMDGRGRRIGFSRAVLRFAAVLLGCIPVGATIVSGVLSTTNRSWHDHLAGTHLIDLRNRLG